MFELKPRNNEVGAGTEIFEYDQPCSVMMQYIQTSGVKVWETGRDINRFWASRKAYNLLKCL